MKSKNSGKVRPMLKKFFRGKHFLVVMFLIFTAELIYRIVSAALSGGSEALGYYVHLAGTFTLCFALLLLPAASGKKFRLQIPDETIALHAFMVFMAMYLGVLRGWYYIFRPFDIIIHFTATGLLALLGFAIAGLFHEQGGKLKPMLAAMFAFGFSMSLGVVWELLEFGMDFFFDTNNQHFLTYDRQPRIGQDALMNTMLDLLANTGGALAVSAAGYVTLAREGKWMERFYVTRKLS